MRPPFEQFFIIDCHTIAKSIVKWNHNQTSKIPIENYKQLETCVSINIQKS